MIESGSWVIEVNGESNLITIGKHNGGEPKIQINENDILLHRNGGEFLGLNKSSGLTVRSKNNTMQFESSGVTINGSKIKLG